MKTALRHTSFVGLLTASLSSILLAGCSNQHPGVSFNVGYHPIVSTRPQTATDTIAIVKLKESPLLATVQLGADGKKTIDEARAKAVMAEQDAVIAKLEEISPKIEVLYRYRLVVNGLAIVTPLELLPKVRELGNVSYVEVQTGFTRPVLANDAGGVLQKVLERTSTKFIGATDAHARGIRGQGLKIGILDTGIDYTHAMFGGAGTEEAFKAIDPSKETSSFPTTKVVGGIDLVGTAYDSGSADFSRRTPKVDQNPIDEGGHGSHVAGTVAGRGDGVTSYDGVAPDALLYAIKVFGADGSTGDAVVVAGLEYSADPNADLNLDDQLDVVNLSLGSSYGNPHILYTEAMGHLSRAGTVVVASAGNSGNDDYIVGAPSVADEALSVAASVDDMDQNWRFRAIRFTSASKPEVLVEAIESTLTTPIEELGAPVTGPLVFVGLADKDLEQDVKDELKGNVALIDRGGVTFAEKIRRAEEAGAIGVVVVNNKPDAPFAMGGEGEFKIPAVMIAKALGDELKAEMAGGGSVTIDFKTDAKIEKPELIDTIANFSSKGPRSLDALLKPEIAAPGNLVISAAMGGGSKVVQMSGTSMAAPHMAGVMALLKQRHPTLTSAELKSLAMSTAKTMLTEEKKVYPLSRQGAGRVQVLKALDAKLVTSPAAVSLGEVTIESRKQIRRVVTLKSIAGADLTLDVKLEGASQGLTMKGPASVTVAANATSDLTLVFTVDVTGLPPTARELDGLVVLSQAGQEIARVPVLAIAEKVSRVSADELLVRSTSAEDAFGATVDLVLSNPGVHAGDAYLFNHIASGARKEDDHHDPFVERSCDLQEAGYRVIMKKGVPTLQIAAKIFEPTTTWDGCEISVLIDADRDGTPEQELVGTKQDHLPGLTAETFASLLLDATKARDLRRQFELDTQAKKEDVEEDYTTALLGIHEMFAPQFSTVAIVEAPVSQLRLRGSGEIAVRILASLQEANAVEPDDFLSKDPKDWTALNVSTGGAAFTDLPEKVALAPGETKTVSFTHGAGDEKLLVLAPTNRPAIGSLKTDRQSVIVEPTYRVDLTGSK